MHTALSAVRAIPPVDVSANKMIEKISYRGWKNAYGISNATVELIVLADVDYREFGCNLRFLPTKTSSSWRF